METFANFKEANYFSNINALWRCKLNRLSILFVVYYVIVLTNRCCVSGAVCTGGSVCVQTSPQIESVQFCVIPDVGRGCFCCLKAFGLSSFLKHLCHQQFFF